MWLLGLEPTKIRSILAKVGQENGMSQNAETN